MSHAPKSARIALPVALAALLLAGAEAPAQKTVAEAISIALGAMGSGPRPAFVGAAIDDSVDGETWNLIFLGAGFGAERRIISLVDGKIQAEAPRTVWPFSTGNYDTLRSQELAVSIPALRRLAADRATRVGIKPASLKYVLNRRVGEIFAVWDIYLVDRKRIVIGHIRLDAASGTVIREEFSAGNVSGTQPAPPATPPTATPQNAAPQPSPSIQHNGTGRTSIRISR
jgi:hypothetical protein